MWQIENDTHFAAERTFTRAHDGAEVFVVAVRATFDVGADGEGVPRAEQLPPLFAPEFFGAPDDSSLRYDTDFVTEKPGTDIVAHATAYAPGGRPATTVPVMLSMGNWSTAIRVVGDRVWQPAGRGLRPTAPVPFTSMAIAYERAWGGSCDATNCRDEANPVGCGAFARAGERVPNLEPLDRPITDAASAHRATAFGPVASQWEPRRSFAGTHDEAWRRTRAPLRPVDFDLRATRCAPVSQQLPDFVRGGEWITLTNLTESGHARWRVPYLDLVCHTRFRSTRQRHRGRIVTVCLEPDRAQLTLTWVSELPCHHSLYELDECRVVQLPRRVRADRREAAPVVAW
ncbi:MAG: DUF2169 domain-containing protein [Gemmatimonadaceae bacterium]|nr:DUF2169 domain-containing protein [Gemmatimonadaceae bacterium]